MCGIAGFCELGRRRTGDGKALLEAICDTLHYRGPDRTSTYLDPEFSIGLAHRRLSIIDLNSGDQPMWNEDKSVGIVFNGEIYNYLELRAAIERRHEFCTQSDTEVLLHLYEEKGVAMLEDLNGMFAFAIWDARRERLFLARDRAGIKPIYYTTVGDTFLFGSEVKALLCCPDVPRELDVRGLYHFLSLRAVPAPLTLFHGISKLRAGSYIVVDKQSGVSEQKDYWRLDEQLIEPLPPASENEYVERLRELMADSVRLQMRSDVPVGAFLSGGIDSSLIVGLMSQLTDLPIETYSVGFREQGYSELCYAREVAETFRTNHHECVLDPDTFFSYVPLLVHHFDDPVADAATIPIYCLAKMAREDGIRVMLSGEGSDEMLGGYSKYLNFFGPMALRNVMRRAPSALRSLLGGLVSSVPLRDEKRIPWALAASGKPCYPGHAWEPLDGVFTDYAAAEAAGAMLEEYYDLPDRHQMDATNAMLYLDFKVRLADDMLNRLDRMTMAASIEGRVPFLDHRICEFLLRVPGELKIKNGDRKHILKKVAEPILPDGIVARKKRGFPVPMEDWFRRGYGAALREFIGNGSIPDHALNTSRIAQMLDAHETGKADFGRVLWRLLFFAWWHRHWIQQEPLHVDPSLYPHDRKSGDVETLSVERRTTG